MDILTAIHARRSIRKFTDEPVTDEQIRIMLDAAMIAPSAGNSRPWQFIIVDDKDLLQQVPGINPYAAMVPQSAVSIVICGDPSLEKYQGFWVQDCSAAIQNMLLAATALGIGTVWTGIYPVAERVEAFRRLLGVPEHVIPLALVAMGRPASPFTSQNRFENEKIHRNTFGQPTDLGS